MILFPSNRQRILKEDSVLNVLGVCLTLTAIAVGPFFQQSITFFSTPTIDLESPAYVSAARTYNVSLITRAIESSHLFGML